MFSTIRAAALAAAALGLCAGVTIPAQAAYVLTLQQVPAGGGITDVVATGNGTINLTGLTFALDGTGSATAIFINPKTAQIQTGVETEGDLYKGFTGPTNFGSGNTFTGASSDSGNIVGINGGSGLGLLLVPHNYGSGNPLSSSATWDNATFTSLGATPGTYTWTWGTGANADSFTLQIGPAAATPEPASLPLMAIGLAGLGMVLRTRRA